MRQTTIMGNRRPELCAVVAYLILATASLSLAQEETGDGEKKGEGRPSISMRARPNSGVTPARIVLTAELVGGADDFQEYYCPTVVWEWGDETVSESTIDCDPYEEGITQIKRRHRVEHVFRRSGTYKVYFHMKRRSKVVTSASVTVHVHAGARDFSR